MAKTRVTNVAVFVGDVPDEIRAAYGTRSYGARPFAHLYIGDRVDIHVSGSSPAALRKLAACAEELAAWLEQQAGGESDG